MQQDGREPLWSRLGAACAPLAYGLLCAAAGLAFANGFLVSCEAPRATTAQGSATSGQEREATVSALDDPAGEGGGPPRAPRIPPCQGVKQAVRTFIGFAEGQGLDDFGATASEAKHVLRAVKTQLCRLDERRDNGLHAASLAGSGLEISAVRFTRADLSGADVDVANGGEEDAQLKWTVRMTRQGTAWSVLASHRR